MRPSLAFYNTIAEVDLLVAIRHMPKPDRATALCNLAIAFEHYKEEHPHSALKYRSPREFRRLVEAST